MARGDTILEFAFLLQIYILLKWRFRLKLLPFTGLFLLFSKMLVLDLIVLSLIGPHLFADF